MLSIQPVNLTNQYSFKGATRPMEEDYSYSKIDYESDKSDLEGHLEELNEIIENTNVPKPIRVIGKIASIGIGAGLGFVSMKFGAQGVTKLVKKGVAYTKELLNKPLATKIIQKANDATTFTKGKLNNLTNTISENAKFKAATEKLAGMNETFKTSKVGAKINDIANTIAESNVVKKTKDIAKDVKTKIKGITSEQVENAVVNLFAVSGGVTGGITALQESVRKDA